MVQIDFGRHSLCSNSRCVCCFDLVLVSLQMKNIQQWLRAHRLLRHDCGVRHAHHVDVLPHVTRTGRRLYGHILYTHIITGAKENSQKTLKSQKKLYVLKIKFVEKCLNTLLQRGSIRITLYTYNIQFFFQFFFHMDFSTYFAFQITALWNSLLMPVVSSFPNILILGPEQKIVSFFSLS